MKQEERTINGRTMVMLSTDADHILHVVGSPDYPEFRRTTVRPEAVGRYEEVAVADIPPMTDAEYSRRVAEKIRVRYTVDDELALVNNMLSDNPTEEHRAEYAEYQTFRQECKAEVRGGR